jgi:hypothetical protein
MLGQLLRWWRRRRRRRSFRRLVQVPSLGNVPVPIAGDAIYIVGSGQELKWVVLSCPCRCGDRIVVNLMRSRRPAWRADVHNGQVTLEPSLWRAADTCRSHFLLQSNAVLWVER